MKISTKGRYAVEALLYMALHKGEKWNVKIVAEAIGVTERYLEQIFHLLKKAEILETIRGPKGGYMIKGPLEDLKVGQIIRAVEGEIIPVPCVHCQDACTCDIKDICATRELWCKLLVAITEVIDGMTLQDLVKKYIIAQAVEGEV
ncbi:MAG: RrF2 family transcriptional regulator [Cellulosilyticaceae bacterium]